MIGLSLQLSMDIPNRKVLDTENSEHDAFFHVQSQLLLPKKNPNLPPYRMTYKKSFEPILAQTLLKKTLNTSWTERHFVLTSTRLLYFTDASQRDLKGCFILASLVPHKLAIKFNPPEICFLVSTDDQTAPQKTLLLLRIENPNVFKEWEQSLGKVLMGLESLNPKDLLLFPKIKPEHLRENNSKLGISEGNFWNRRLISMDELLRYGSHMDIILLRSKNPIFYLHRFFMRSHYDHVGVLVKDQTERLYILEAIQSKGVCLSSLESLLLTFQQEYEEIAYRKLIIEGKAAMQIEQLQEYINKILGSKYQLSITKLLMDNASIDVSHEQAQNTQDPPNQQRQHQKTYFCSELVADIYLKFGILAEGKSNNFWPKDFEEDSMVFTKDFRLGPLLQVQMEDPPDSSEVSSN